MAPPSDLPILDLPILDLEIPPPEAPSEARQVSPATKPTHECLPLTSSSVPVRQGATKRKPEHRERRESPKTKRGFSPESSSARGVSKTQQPPTSHPKSHRGNSVSIHALTDRDVLAGRGHNQYNQHPGNKAYMEVVASLIDRYEGNMPNRTKLGETVVDTVYQRGGRFLRRVGHEAYAEMSRKEAIQKARKCIGEKRLRVPSTGHRYRLRSAPEASISVHATLDSEPSKKKRKAPPEASVQATLDETKRQAPSGARQGVRFATKPPTCHRYPLRSASSAPVRREATKRKPSKRNEPSKRNQGPETPPSVGRRSNVPTTTTPPPAVAAPAVVSASKSITRSESKTSSSRPKHLVLETLLYLETLGDDDEAHLRAEISRSLEVLSYLRLFEGVHLRDRIVELRRIALEELVKEEAAYDKAEEGVAKG